MTKDYTTVVKLWYKLLELTETERTECYRYLTENAVTVITLLDYLRQNDKDGGVATENIIDYFVQNKLLCTSTVQRTLTALRKNDIIMHKQSPYHRHRHYLWQLAPTVHDTVATIDYLYQ